MLRWSTFGILPVFHCWRNREGGHLIKMDNSAGRSFLLRSGVGRIRHISVRVPWMQQRVKEKGLIPSRVPSRENPADLGTKRLAKERMEYLMCLCKVYNIDTSEFVGINAYDKVQEQDNMKASIRLLKEQGYSAPKHCKTTSQNPPSRLESFRDGYGSFYGWSLS